MHGRRRPSIDSERRFFEGQLACGSRNSGTGIRWAEQPPEKAVWTRSKPTPTHQGRSTALEGIVYLNGEFVPVERATISVYDHGFLYGDGVFESMATASSSIFKLDEHLDRLYRSAAALRLRIPITKEELAAAVRETVRRNSLQYGYIRLVVSRGAGYPSLDPRAAERPTVAILVHSRAIPERTERQDSPMPKVRAITVILASTRRTPSESVDARIKACNYLNHILARLEAIEAGVDDAILLDTNGYIAEATASNIFVVEHDVLATPPIGNVLEGVTRATVIDIARERGHTVLERQLSPYDMFTADEVFLASTFGGLTPVGKVAGRLIGDGEPGPMTLQLRGIVHAMRDNAPEPARPPS
jgi:branched-chain amino acid aminotransferase